MPALLKSAIKLMNKLNFKFKLMLIGAISAFLIFVLTFQLVRASREDILFFKSELFGVRYIQPLMNVMINLQNYRALDINKEFVTSDLVNDKLTTLRDTVDISIKNLNIVNDQLDSKLKTTNQWNLVISQWEQFKNKSVKDFSSADFADISGIINSITNLIILVCDNSNITLDPSIDGYYLGINYCVNLPNMMEEAALIRSIGKQTLLRKSLTEQDKQTLIIQKTFMNDLNKIAMNSGLDKVIQQDPRFAQVIDNLKQTVFSNVGNLTKLLDNSILANNLTLNPDEFAREYTGLIDNIYTLDERVGESLAQVLETAIHNTSVILYVNLTISIIGFLVLMYIFVGIYYSIMESIKNLIKRSHQLANGDLNAAIELKTKDELILVAESFNTILSMLTKLINELETVVKNVKEGNLSYKIDLTDKKGFVKTLGNNINDMSDIFEDVTNQVNHTLDLLSKGNLTEKIKKDYQGKFGELKQYTNISVESLSRLVKNIKTATKNIHHAAQDISQGNNDLAKRTEQQAAFLEETSASIEQLTVTVKKNAENAKQANHLAQTASDVAIKGGSAVNQVVATMSVIHESSNKVADIISVIDSIAFQTNILALNAAVEAARAGEQGRGFAVVATEVRNLAQRTSTAAKQIKELISASVENVSGGAKLVDQAGQTMGEILTAVKQVTEIMAEITSASIEQSSGIEQVNQAITQIDKVTQQNNTLVEKAAQSAVAMETQTSHMDKLVNLFKVNKENISDSLSSDENLLSEQEDLITKLSDKVATNDGEKKSTNRQKETEHWDEF